MNTKSIRLPLVLVVGLFAATFLAAACATPEPEAEQPTAEEVEAATTMAPKVPPAVSVNALMVAQVDHAAHEIWDVPLTPPADDMAWTQLEYHAIQLAAAGTLVSMGGTGPADAGWANLPAWTDYSQQMTDLGVQALAAARAKDVSQLSSIGDSLVQTCEDCHKEFKPDLPTEGLVHTPHYQH